MPFISTSKLIFRIVSFTFVLFIFVGPLVGDEWQEKNINPAKTSCDIVVFSYNRPLQIYAFLESLYHYSSHIHTCLVLYRCSAEEFRIAYREVMEAFPQVRFIEQSDPPHDFKPLLIQEVFRPQQSDFVAFAVDDLIITDEIDFSSCIEALKSTNAYAFYLRLGKNIDDCFSSGNYEGIPNLTKVNEKMFSWVFETGIGNWAYPNTVDMTIYRKKDLEANFRTAPFYHPNSLEDYFGVANYTLMGLCYETSRAVNFPLNIVSETTATAHLDYSVNFLLDRFNDGLKIDISPLHQFNNRSTHYYLFSPSYIYRR